MSKGDGKIFLIDVAEGTVIRSWEAHKGGTRGLDFHPSGRFLASGGDDNYIRIWSIPSCEPFKAWVGHDRSVLSLDFSPDGKLLASGSMNTQIAPVTDTRIWALESQGIDGAVVSMATPQNKVIDQPILCLAAFACPSSPSALASSIITGPGSSDPSTAGSVYRSHPLPLWLLPVWRGNILVPGTGYFINSRN
ncbi:MAG TPA: hypothetical protein VMW76_05590 [Bacteroidales bacterium]|nr:hypothetical protein [Bacteroidales bacterium]